MRTRLSKDFVLAEFTRSQKADELGRAVIVEPGSAVDGNLRHLCGTVLQLVRDALGRVTVSSGFRPPWLNKAVGGSRTSDHMHGLAADVTVEGRTPLEVARWIAGHMPSVKQVIHEHGRWVHVSIWPEGETGESTLLTAYKPLPTADNPKPKTIYVSGLHKINKLREQTA